MDLTSDSAAPDAELETEEARAPDDESETQNPAGTTDEQPESPAEEETEEVEHEGKTYKIPKPLKGALLMQADYTRKTQEVAEQRKAIEQRQAAFAEEQKLLAEHLTEFGKVSALNDAIAQFEKADWPQIRASNPQLYNDLWFQYQQTKEQRDKAVTALQTKVAERSSKAQQESARRIEEARAAIQRDIPDWSPDLAGKLSQFAQGQGFTADELRQVTDPRLIKLLHAAWKGSQAQQKEAAQARAKPAEVAKPLPTVSGNTPAEKGLSDRLPVDEWIRRRNAQLAKQRGRR